MVPTFYLRRIKTDKWYYTFCSPEASQCIVKYLLTRQNLKLGDKLFDFTYSTLLARFQEIATVPLVERYLIVPSVFILQYNVAPALRNVRYCVGLQLLAYAELPKLFHEEVVADEDVGHPRSISFAWSWFLNTSQVPLLLPPTFFQPVTFIWIFLVFAE